MILISEETPMLNLKRLSQYFSFSQESDELVSERYRNCMRQIPLMYLILGINMVLICIVHIGVVPAALIIYFPAAFLFIFVLRIYFWLRSRSIQKSISQIRSDLSTTIFFGRRHFLRLCDMVCRTFFSYGDAHTKGQVIFFLLA